MKIINPHYKILTTIDYPKILETIESAGRIAYKSENKITKKSAETFIKMIIKRGHESVLEHCSFSVQFICDRGISHELVRHRIASYTQESTRYCNYSKDKFTNQITVIMPTFFQSISPSSTNIYQKYKAWKNACEISEQLYFELIKLGSKPEEARSVLNNSLKTEIITTMNLREWRYFLKLRTKTSAHPQMRELTIPLLKELQKILPAFFNDIKIIE